MSRNTTVRDKHRRMIAASKPPCALCGKPIDYEARYPDPGSFVVDHVVPLSAGGADALTNKQPAHQRCNRQKSARLDGGPMLRTSGSLVIPW